MSKRRRLRRPTKTILRATVGAAAIVLSGCPAFGNLRAVDCQTDPNQLNCLDASVPDDLAGSDMRVDGAAPDLAPEPVDGGTNG